MTEQSNGVNFPHWKARRVITSPPTVAASSPSDIIFFQKNMLPFPGYSNNGLFRLRRAFPGTRRQRWLVFKPYVSPEFRLIGYVILLYAVFITWGYLQEKIASAEYDMLPSYRHYGVLNKWNYPIVLNVFMSLSCTMTAAIVEAVSESNNPNKVPFFAFWKVAITSALASPIGYESL
eukprot:gene39124-47602_t